jgi:hypothetical protein
MNKSPTRHENLDRWHPFKGVTPERQFIGTDETSTAKRGKQSDVGKKEFQRIKDGLLS